MWQYHNPVSIVFGQGSFAELPRLLEGRDYALVTYPDPAFTALGERLRAAAGAPVLVIDDIAPNPDLARVAEQSGRFADIPEVIVALGGGSVIDSAKVFAVAGGDFDRVRRLLETGQGADDIRPPPIIAVPTTAGTGSEVTSWGTIWDGSGSVKHSLALSALYPSFAVIDPELMLGKPRGLTVITGLDALSHTLESLWNKNANPVSATFAVKAAREILKVLPLLADDLGNIELRTRMARAALFAGLAFSNTKTAIAHSLSYPLTLRHGVPHGIACSFTLPMILRSVDGVGGPCEEALHAIFDAGPLEGALRLERFLGQLEVSTDPAAYGVDAGAWERLVISALDGDRGQNFIGTAQSLLAASGQAGERQPRGARP